MRKITKYALLFAAALLTTAGLSSCSDDNNDNGETAGLTNAQKEMKAVGEQYVSNTVNSTYKYLAKETANLYTLLDNDLTKFRAGTLTQSDIDQTCETFKKARSYYESSEAFLFGAATDFGIDPHIDTWPLNVSKLATTLKNKDQVKQMEEDNDVTVLGETQLGFHGIEFVLFRNGANRTLAALKANETDKAFTKINANVTGEEELVFAKVVALDLRDKCWQMEVAWNENAPKEHKDRMKELEYATTVNGGDYSYGQNFLAAGNAGSTYRTWQAAMNAIIIAGCENICDEVANTKIGNPYSGEDENYIESPYSERSFYDFQDNIRSIENSLYGGRSDDNSRNTSKSLIQFMKNHNYEGLAQLESDLKASINALEDCKTLKGGFVNNIHNVKVGVAQKAIQALDKDLTAAGEWMSKQ